LKFQNIWHDFTIIILFWNLNLNICPVAFSDSEI
jgi:hypothetical protein